MTLSFYKYQGAGNDFIIIDERETSPVSSRKDKNKLIASLCDRRFGIGADGLMLLKNQPGYDFQMVYYNSDGLEGTMCGNGGRCLVAFAAHQGIISTKALFLAVDGPHHAQIINAEANNQLVSLEMKDVSDIQTFEGGFVLDTGSPHFVVFKTDIQNIDLDTLGKTWRNNPVFGTDGVNFNIAEIVDNTIHVRTYERGVEEETLACGTGIAATAIALHYRNNQSGNHHYELRARGGDMQVTFENKKPGFYTSIYLHGPATKVFHGDIDI